MPTLPHRTWLERVSLGLAITLIGLGLLTVAGWWLQLDDLLVPFGIVSATKINTAFGLAILGGALLAIDLNRPRFALVAALTALIGGATMAQDLWGRSFGIDQALVVDRYIISTPIPGRMAFIVSACLLFGGLVVAWRSTRRGAGSRIFAEAVVGSLVASAGFSTLLGYAAGLDTVYRWGSGAA
ncbi:MAG TPA: hypothetical protein VGE76_05650, partial [Opitutaceae bacterium]